MATSKTLLISLSFILGFLPVAGRCFDPERDVAVAFKNGAVTLALPIIAHATEIEVLLKPGSPGKLKVGPFPPPAGKDAMNANYWAGNVRIPVKGEGLADPVVIAVSYMTCLEGEGGQCFPPVHKELRVRAADIPGVASEAKTKEMPLPPAAPAASIVKTAPEVEQASRAGDAEALHTPNVAKSAEPPSEPKTALIKMLILFFLGGIGASLTPCVLPMIPITMAVIGAQKAGKIKGMLLGLALTQGMALTYTVLGVISALTGSIFGQFAQSPAFLIPVSIIFALFAISLFGAFEIKLPDSLAGKLQSSGPRKGLLGAFAVGLMLGPISAPCVGPLIGAALVDIGVNRQVFEGALKMFIFAQGMGLLFIIGGMAVSALPKSGDWLTRFKQALGVVVLGFAVWNIRLIAPEWANYAMWALTMLLAAGALGAFEAALGLMGGLRKGLGLFVFVIAALLGARSLELYLEIPLLPRGGAPAADAEGGAHHALWIEHDFEEALDRAKTENKLVLVDTFTEWCAQCKELDEKTWPDPAVIGWIQKNAIAVRIDTEKMRPDLAKPLGIAAYPTIILMDAKGKEIRRLNGFHRPEKMLEWLSR
jgi:thiol:disulfide interchange protein DsbD